MANSFSGGQCFRTAEKFSAYQEMRPPVFQPALCFSGFRFFWRVGLLPDRKFQHGKIRATRFFRLMNLTLREVRHQPLAKTSGMNGQLKDFLHPALSTPHHYCARLHICTHIG